MAITAWPDDISLGQAVQCAVCRQELLLKDAAAGALYADGRQAFACNSHFWDSPKLIRGWAEFVDEQYRLFRKRNIAATYLPGGDDAFALF